MTGEYVPCGSAWEEELMKCSKRFLVDLLRISIKERYTGDEKSDIGILESTVEAALRGYKDWPSVADTDEDLTRKLQDSEKTINNLKAKSISVHTKVMELANLF